MCTRVTQYDSPVEAPVQVGDYVSTRWDDLSLEGGAEVCEPCQVHASRRLAPPLPSPYSAARRRRRLPIRVHRRRSHSAASAAPTAVCRARHRPAAPAALRCQQG